MESLLILGALAYGMHHYNKTDDVELMEDKQINYAFDEGIHRIDWSKAGNFRTTSTENNVKWVIVTNE